MTTTTIPWTDTPQTTCPCTNQDCTAIHADQDILDERYAFWVKDDKTGTYYAAADIDTFTLEVTDMEGDQPYTPGEAIVKDLATGDQMDAAAFMARAA
jgi:hypothetical protein